MNLIHRKSMKSRPGALKRREKVDKGERERFARNLAEMNGKKAEERGNNGVEVGDGLGLHDRWAALRAFVSQTLEEKPELKTLKT